MKDSDHARFLGFGGFVGTNGYFRVDGATVPTRCEIVGAGESPPGIGGTVCVGVTGSVLFNEGGDDHLRRRRRQGRGDLQRTSERSTSRETRGSRS